MENVDMNKNVMGVYYSKSKYDVASIVAPFKGEIKKIFLLSFLINLFTIMMPLFVMFLIDGKVQLSFEGRGVFNIVFLISILCFNFVFRYMRASVVNFILCSLDTNICNGILDKVFKIPVKKMEKKNDAFWHSVFNDIDVIRNGLSGSYIINLFDIPFLLLFMAIIGVLFGKYFFVMLFLFLLFLFVIISNKRT